MTGYRIASRVGRLEFLSEANKRDIHVAVLESLGNIGMPRYPLLDDIACLRDSQADRGAAGRLCGVCVAV